MSKPLNERTFMTSEGGGLEAPVTGLVYRHIMAVTPAGRQVRVSDTTVASKTRHCVRAPCPTLITPVH